MAPIAEPLIISSPVLSSGRASESMTFQGFYSTNSWLGPWSLDRDKKEFRTGCDNPCKPGTASQLPTMNYGTCDTCATQGNSNPRCMSYMSCINMGPVRQRFFLGQGLNGLQFSSVVWCRNVLVSWCPKSAWTTHHKFDSFRCGSIFHDLPMFCDVLWANNSVFAAYDSINYVWHHDILIFCWSNLNFWLSKPHIFCC